MSPCVKSGKLGCLHCHTSSGRDRIAVHYIKRPPALTTSGNDPVIPEQYQRLIVQGALYNVLVKDTKFETAQRWKMEYEAEVARMAAEIHGFVKPRQMRWKPYDVENRNKVLKSATEG